jgi:hypothetical protein
MRNEMRNVSQAVGMLGVGLLTAAATGCVEQEASLSMRGVVKYEGTRGEEAVECPVENGGGGGMDGEMEQTKTVQAPTFECSRNTEPGAAESFRFGVRIDLSDFKSGGGGQRTTARSGGPSQSDICNMEKQQFTAARYGQSGFELAFDIRNRLEDSRNVGSVGQGGGGGGFEGLHLDANDIQLKELVIRWPEVGSSGDLGLDKNLGVSIIAESDGGGALLNMPIFSAGDIQSLEELHKQLVRERAGLSNYNDRAKRTSVTIDADIYVKGETLGERPVESTHLEFPFTICGKGCDTTPVCDFQVSAGGGG